MSTPAPRANTLFSAKARASQSGSGAKTATTTLGISGISALARQDAAGLPRFVKRLNLLIYGPPGTAKTVTAHGLPNTRTLDFDNGMQSVEWAIRAGKLKKSLEEIVYKTILPPANDPKSTHVLDEAILTLEEWLADEDIPPEEWNKPYPQFWDTLIIDSGSSLTDGTIIKGLVENKRLELSKSLDKLQGKIGVTPMRQADWGSASSLFQKFLNRCRSSGKNVVLICHEYIERDDGDSGSGNVLGIMPLVIGQLREKLPKDFDEVWYSHVTGTRNDPKYKLQTTPDALRRLRSRLGCLDAVEDGDFEGIKQKIAKFYGVDPALLWVAAHGSAEREAMEAAEQAAGENATI